MEPKTTINCCQHISVHAMSECAFSWLIEGEERTRKRGPQKILDGLIDGIPSPQAHVCCMLNWVTLTDQLPRRETQVIWKTAEPFGRHTLARYKKVLHSHKKEKPKILDSNYFTL